MTIIVRRTALLLFVPIAPLVLFLLLSLSVWRLRTVRLDPSSHQRAVVASDNSLVLPSSQDTGVQTHVEEGDARVQIVADFLTRHDSPLTPADHYARSFVETADRYQLDYRLLPAIAMQESNLCKSIIADSYNCLGFGIHERGTLTFDSYEASFDRAARELKERYVDQGLTTPEAIMKKYTPSSNGSWAFSVNQWISEMEYNDRQHARDERIDNNLLEYTK